MSFLIDGIEDKARSFLGERIPAKKEKGKIEGYYRILDAKPYAIYERAKGADKIIAAYGDMVIKQNYRNPNKLTIYPYYKNHWIKKNIFLNAKMFPGLIEGSKILLCAIWPYMRTVARDQYVKSFRINIITDKAQIFHNYPARDLEYEGISLPGDIYRFEESVVWDLPGRKFPSNKIDCNEWERYYPNLPDDCYQHHPVLSSDTAFSDTYKNGGFGATTSVVINGESKLVPRFYLYSRKEQANPFHFIGTGEKNYKLNLMATYRSNADVGVRTCIFASSDGGRQWYCKYEFADLGEYEFTQGHTGEYGRNFGNPIIKRRTLNDSRRSVNVSRRMLVIPNKTDKEPKCKFIWEDKGEAFFLENAEQISLETITPHGMKTGNIVALSVRERYKGDSSWMFNNAISESSAGNNMLFKIEVLDEKRFALYELVSSPDNNIPCRHIHHINRIKDGWIIGTGEIYPNGWLFYLQVKGADTFTRVDASDEFSIVRLNSTETSVQRTMGMVLREDVEHTILYASDHDCLDMSFFEITDGRTEKISHNSTGVYKGQLSTIDNRDTHTLVFDATEPCFYFQQLNSFLLFCGQRGELGISFDDGATWERERLKEPIIHYYGSNGHRYYFDHSILVKK